ncbi:AP-3 complex subunit sigma-like protein, partial [Dinothrombium tinctorium]
MVQNFMFDSKYNDTFLMYPYPNSSHNHWWNDAEPLWVTAEKQGVKTAVFWWDGCQVTIRNMTPTHCSHYQPYWTWPKPKEDTIEAMHTILESFEYDEWQLALVYYEAVDAVGHAWGPDTEERLHAVRDLDEILNDLQSEIEARKMQDEVTVILVSDHGMLSVDPDGNKTVLIDIENLVEEDDISLMLDRGSVFNALKKASPKGLNFYRKAELPLHYHIRNHRRVAPIVLVAEKGYFVRGFSDSLTTKPVWDVMYPGHHGYDPYKVQQMRTIMFGMGRKLKRNYLSEPLMMTDHYNLICHLLGIEAQPNNGSWLRVQNMITEPSSKIRRHVFENKAFVAFVTKAVPSADSSSESRREENDVWKMIKAIIVFNNNGKPRITKFYQHYSEDLQQQIIRETFLLVSKRDDNVCNFLEGGSLIGGSDFKLIYRHYATLYFVFCVDSSESELGILDLIQVFVETLDKCFENVCELDLIFHVDKVHHILNEVVMGGMVLETNMTDILVRIDEQSKIEKDEAGLAAAPSKAMSAMKNLPQHIPQQWKDVKLADITKISKLKL